MTTRKDEFYRYGKKYDTHLEHEKIAEKTNFNGLKKLGVFSNCKTVLVVGCPNTFFIEECNASGMDAKGVDIDPEIVDKKIVFKCDIENEKLPFKDKTFDIVYSKGLIQHLNKPPINFMKEIARVVKSGGHFVIIVRNEKSIPNMLSIWDNYKHKCTWTPMSIKRMMEDFGFDVVHIDPRFNFNPTRSVLCSIPFKWNIGSTIVAIGKKR